MFYCDEHKKDIFVAHLPRLDKRCYRVNNKYCADIMRHLTYDCEVIINALVILNYD